MGHVAIVFVCDSGYIMQTAVAITSLIEHKSIATRYCIYVVCSNINEHQEKMLTSFQQENIEIIIKQQGNKYDTAFIEQESKYRVATTAALFKFDIAELLQKEEKAIYLDGDIIVQDDLTELFSVNISEYYAAVVRDLPQVLYDEPLINTSAGIDYFNSGVMLLNLRLLRKDNIRKKLVEIKQGLVNDNLMDQNVFNIGFYGKVVQLPIKYNVLYANLARNWNKKNVVERLNKLYGSNYILLEDLLYDAVIIHYSSKDKPWIYFDVPLADKWLYYYIKSPYKNIPLIRSSVLDNQKICKKIEENKEVVPVVFATDSNYVLYVNVAIQSIIEHSNIDTVYDIYILHSGLNFSEISLLESLSKENIFIKCVNVGRMIDLIDMNFHICGHYSKEMYYRWLIPEILPQYDKVVYLDCDIVVIKDIKLLLKENYHNYVIGGVANVFNKDTQLRIKRNFDMSIEEYINSGVLIFNVKECIVNEIKRKCLKLIRTTSERILACPDQDILNMACYGKIKLLDDAWNVQWHHQWDKEEKILENYAQKFSEAKNRMAILHFTSEIKPWNNPERPLAYIFWKYARSSPAYEEILYRNMKLVPQKDNKKVSKKFNTYTVNDVLKKIQGGIRCYKEHGMIYTIQRTRMHLKNFFAR